MGSRRRVWGPKNRDLVGWSVDAIGDPNEDGLDDVVVSAPRRNTTATSAGAAYVVFGGDAPGLTTDASILSRVDTSDEGGFTMLGENAYDQAGRAVAGVGDVDGDGVVDLLVGAQYADAGGSSAGRVYLVLGDPTRGSYHPYNRNPQAEPDDHFVTQGASLFVSRPGVLSTDWDAETEASLLLVTAETTTSARGGSVTLYANGAFEFTAPHGQWWGEDSFEYELIDGDGGSSTGTVRILAVPQAVPLDLVAAGEQGYALDGDADFDGAGQAVCHVGDIDDDGFDDFLVGAYEADPGSVTSAGSTYVRYGATSVASPVGLVAGPTDAPGEAAFDWSGIAVGSAGDFNGDGFDDFVVGAIGADPNGNRSGRSYVVFGSGSRPNASLSGLDGTSGFLLDGEMPGDDSGRAVASAGDVNGDGFDDLLVGAYRADGPGLDDEGRVYLVYGTDAAMPASIELADVGGSVPGVAIEGEWNNDYAGFAVAGPGDLDGDGTDDIAIGAYGGPGGTSNAGRTYVVYGGSSLPSTIWLDDVEDSANAPYLGIAIHGETSGDLSGRAIAGAGDVNGDGVADLLIGAPGWGTLVPSIGRAYVVFGGAALSPGGDPIELSDVAAGTGGFTIVGEEGEDGAGAAVAPAGDFNADGYADVVVGAPFASGAVSFGSGRAYLVLGRSDFSSRPVVQLVDVASGMGGFAADGELSFDSAGHAVGGGGDVNRDGFPDVIVGAFNAGPDVAGRTYVLYGGDYIPAQN